jgi:hypothetical protein
VRHTIFKTQPVEIIEPTKASGSSYQGLLHGVINLYVSRSRHDGIDAMKREIKASCVDTTMRV